MLQRRNIAIVIAGLLVGAQIVGAVTSTSSPTSEGAEYAEPAPAQAESTEPAAEPASGATVAEESGYVIPFTGGMRISVAPSATFPSSGEEQEMLPALAEYFDRRAATTVLAGAPGPVFPTSGEEWTMLPAQVAYFDQLEATRMAARDRQLMARSEVTAPAEEVAVSAAPSGNDTPQESPNQ
jgi:hypothetical protein